MGPVHVLGAVRRVAERFQTAGKFASVRLLSGMRTDVGLQVLQATVALVATLELNKYDQFPLSATVISSFLAGIRSAYRAHVGLVAGMPAHMHVQHILRLECLPVALTAGPLAREPFATEVVVQIVAFHVLEKINE